jgi:hypothetical protein
VTAGRTASQRGPGAYAGPSVVPGPRSS